MSSAALQPPAHQPASLSGLEQYTPTHSPGREEYYAKENQAATSPASSKRPSRRTSGQTPAYPEYNNTPTMTSRTALASPMPVMAGDQAASSSRRRHDPPIAPPRVSSSQQDTSSSRRAAREAERANSSRRAESNKVASNGYEESSSRRRPSQQDGVPSGSREGYTTTIPIRSNTSSSSKQLSREASEVLNQIIVSQPEEDLEREQERLEEAQPHHAAPSHEDYDDVATPPPIAATRDDSRQGRRSRHDHSKKEKTSRFGDYYLGHTIGEGEFGKVKLGWKHDDRVQVAIKLIRRDSVGGNPSRLAKIYREVNILRGVSHPNIVRLHEMSETERYIGIVLEYASGGELFDYILTHRYLKDNAARRLFAQLISGVGYLHKKGIVHRDLKLENLLLDRNRNIIITDFGFANTFDANDELSEEEELGLGDRDYVKKMGLDRKKANGSRKGDLMQTSCGSPCYAAPELVVSDSLYTGRKVDVWSCGVILYAMLAGYLPFDDDPANPEGDNINLLYKYIVNTPLTFPEYVTPHARDLLRRILVPSPRKRADLFEVARHSWLSEYAHIVEFITSSTTTSNEIQNTTVPTSDEESSGLQRSASVREPTKAKQPAPVVGEMARKTGQVDPDEAAAHGKQTRDTKRRTVQVEYVAPTTQTQRGGESSGQTPPRGKTRAQSATRGAAETQAPTGDKPLPRDPPVGKEKYTGSPSHRTRPPSAHQNVNAPAPRPVRDAGRSTSEGYRNTVSGSTTTGRPTTGGSTHSAGSRHALGAGATRASMSQPTGGSKNYVISNPMPQEQGDMDFGRPSVSTGGVPPKFARLSGYQNTPSHSSGGSSKGHKRSNTIGEIGGKIFGRSGSIFGGRRKRDSQPPAEKPSRKYPPVSMSNTMPGEAGVRPSMESRRSFSQTLGLARKRSGSVAGSHTSQERPSNPRRFSLMRAMGLSRDNNASPTPDTNSSLPSPRLEGQQPEDYGRYGEPPYDVEPNVDGAYDDSQGRGSPMMEAPTSHPSRHTRYQSGSRSNAIPAHLPQGAAQNSASDSSVDRTGRRPPNAAPYQTGYDSEGRPAGRNRGVLQKNRRFVDAYDGEEYGRTSDHAGSSGAAKRVMDFFRRRGKARGGEA